MPGCGWRRIRDRQIGGGWLRLVDVDLVRRLIGRHLIGDNRAGNNREVAHRAGWRRGGLVVPLASDHDEECHAGKCDGNFLRAVMIFLCRLHEFISLRS